MYTSQRAIRTTKRHHWESEKASQKLEENMCSTGIKD